MQVMVLGPILREADARVKDKSYQRSPVGQHVARYLRALAWENASENTRDSYETTLARLSNDHDDFQNGLQSFCDLGPAGTEYVREFLDRHWRDSSTATRANRLAAVKSCFKWAVDNHVCDFNPAEKIRAPRSKQAAERVAYSQTVIYQLVAAQETLRDQCAIQLMARMGLRKNEVRVLRVGEIDLIRNLLTVHGKGGKVSVLPLDIPSLRNDLLLHCNGRHPDEYLLYPWEHRRQPMNPATMHRWFKRCLEQAGFPPTMKLHELRHSAADHLYRVTGNIVQAQQLLRHSSVLTTQGYLHPTRSDLADALRLVDEDWAGRK